MSIRERLFFAAPNAGLKSLRYLLLFAALLFSMGIIMPMLSITKLVFIKSTFSIVSGIAELLRDGSIILALVIAAFSVVLPILKMVVLYKLLFRHVSFSAGTGRYLRLMHEYGRWAMLDVMVVAVLVATVKLGVVASIQVHFGLYLFGLSVALVMFITSRVVKLAGQDQIGADSGNVR